MVMAFSDSLKAQLQGKAFARCSQSVDQWRARSIHVSLLSLACLSIPLAERFVATCRTSATSSTTLSSTSLPTRRKSDLLLLSLLVRLFIHRRNPIVDTLGPQETSLSETFNSSFRSSSR